MSDGDGDVQSRMEQGTAGSSPSEGETSRFSSRASLCFRRHRMAILIAYAMAVICMVLMGATGGHYWAYLAWGIIGAIIFITCIRFARLIHTVMRGYTIAQRRRQRVSRGALEARLQFNNPGIELGRLRLLLVDRDFTGEDYQTLLDLDENNEVSSSVGASESEIRRNPSFVIKEPPPGSAEKPKSCAICLYPFKPSDKVRIIPCLHQFHTECIDPWLRIKAICPTCKFPAVG